MFFAGKKVVYLSLYHDRQRIQSAGFLQMSKIGEKLKFIVQIKKVGEIPSAEYPVCIYHKEENIQIGQVMLQNGGGYFEKQFPLSGGSVCIMERNMEPADIIKITIKLTEKEQIIGYPVAEKERKEKKVVEIQAEEETIHYREKEPFPKENKIMFREPEPEILCTDKWVQILSKYSNIHPFRDDRVFVSLSLEELVILPEKHQKLIHNSFLLHGFYNYRHIILGKDYRLGSCTDKCFYLGVPGVYFEREKQVAVMFGFEGFECAGSVEIGKFGYYVKEVSI